MYNYYGLEEFEELFKFRFKAYKISMWPVIRYTILDAIVQKKNKVIWIGVSLEKSESLKKLIKSNLDCILKTPFLCPQKDVLFFYSDVCCTRCEDYSYENRVYGGLMDLCKERAAIMETPINLVHKAPNKFDNVYYIDIIDKIVEKEARKIDFDKDDIKNIDALLDFIRTHIDIAIDERYYTAAKDLLLFLSKRIKLYVKHYKMILEKTKPKLIVSEGAHYSEKGLILNFVAKKMGIKVSEIQHGLVNQTLVVYNCYGAASSNASLLKMMPDYFLLWGDFWKDQINPVSQKVVIGSPNFYNKFSVYPSVGKKTLLFLDETRSEKKQLTLNSVMFDLSKRLPDYKIIFRFHPLDKQNEKLLKECDKFPNIQVDKNDDIFKTLKEVDSVVGDISTVLFEAACINKRVYVIDNNLTRIHDNSLFTVFENAEQLEELILKNHDNNDYISKESVESIFNSNYNSNFLKFLESVGITL